MEEMNSSVGDNVLCYRPLSKQNNHNSYSIWCYEPSVWLTEKSSRILLYYSV